MDVKKIAYLLQRKSNVLFKLIPFVGRLYFQDISDCKYLYLIDSALLIVTSAGAIDNFTIENSISFVASLPKTYPTVHQISGYLMEFQSASLRAQFELDIFNA